MSDVDDTSMSAEQLLKEAREAIKTKDRAAAVSKLQQLVTEYPTTTPGQQAKKALGSMNSK